MELEAETQPRIMGMVVDSVSEVRPIKANEMESPPVFGVSVAVDYILAMAKSDGKVKILLNIDKVLNLEDNDRFDKAA